MRPKYHFSPAQNWMNDPNGLIYFKGLYHLFFQYNPLGNQWGNMSWGHASSSDLFNWKEHGVALRFNETHGIFSGSMVVDYFNTSKFGTVENPAMVAIFTDHKHDGSNQAQSLAFSLDEGSTWELYKDNPVLDLGMKNFRDPKVNWNKTNEAWVMSVVKPEEHTVSFYKSRDLIDWDFLSDFRNENGSDGVWECPDFFQLPVDGDKNKIKWVLFVSANPGGITGGSGTHYFIGDWDGVNFTADTRETRWLDFGRDNYAGVTWNDAPDKRRIYIGWMNNWEYAREIPANPSRGIMTLPRELFLKCIQGKITLVQNPVVEIKQSKIYDESFSIEVKGCKSGIRFVNKEGKYVEIGYEPETSSIYLDRSNLWFDFAPAGIQRFTYIPADSQIQLRALIDNGSIEIFIDGGQFSISSLLAPSLSPLNSQVF